MNHGNPKSHQMRQDAPTMTPRDQETLRLAVARVSKFLHERELMLGIEQSEIASLHLGDEKRAAVLLKTDLQAIICHLSEPAPEPTDKEIDAVCGPERSKRWKNDGRQYDRDTARLVLRAFGGAKSEPAAPVVLSDDECDAVLARHLIPRDGCSVVELLNAYREMVRQGALLATSPKPAAPVVDDSQWRYRIKDLEAIANDRGPQFEGQARQALGWAANVLRAADEAVKAAGADPVVPDGFVLTDEAAHIIAWNVLEGGAHKWPNLWNLKLSELRAYTLALTKALAAAAPKGGAA